MATLNNESQRELRQQIAERFGYLLEQLKGRGIEDLYSLAGQINSHFDQYCGNAEILTEKPKELVDLI
jgi:hypothetical protein